MDILVIKKKNLRQSRYLQPDPVCVVLMMFVLFLISRYFVGDVWSKGGYNWYRDSWGWWMILAILAISHLAPGHHSSQLTCCTNDWGLHFSVQKASRQQQPSVWGVTWHNPDKLKPQRALGRESSWPAITDHKNWRVGAGHCRVNRNTDPR